jgi:DNA-binding TFAR19-related protein (PDSD5 family)
MSDDELEAIRQKKMASLREQALREQAEEQAVAEAQAQKEAILRQTLLQQLQGKERERKVKFR